MRLVVTTPTVVVEDVEGIRHIRAEDRTGAFGILPGHADFVTVLPISVVSWQDKSGREGYVLVRRGVLTVADGELVEIAARGGYREDELPALSNSILASLQDAEEQEYEERTSDRQMHLAMIRQIERVLGAKRGVEVMPRLDKVREAIAP
jgi:F-type H+-transporting ATPase subunit epsilon